MGRVRAGARSLIILAAAFACAVITVLLPTNAYQRWQLLDTTIHKNARWFYERVHFDATPIDVMFVGPSRVGAGIDAVRMQRDLAARGVLANVVNFALPEAGRNLNAVIVREAFKTKRPKLIVIGITEQPSRFGHSAFKYIAPSSAILNPGYAPDLNYFSDLVYLPYRQLELFIANLAPGVAGLSKQFDRSRYPGAALPITRMLVLPDGSYVDGDQIGEPAEVERGVHKLVSGTKQPLLPPRLADVEFGDERHYVRDIVAMAREHGTKVAFVVLPYYSSPAVVTDEGFYGKLGPGLERGLRCRAHWLISRLRPPDFDGSARRDRLAGAADRRCPGAERMIAAPLLPLNPPLHHVGIIQPDEDAVAAQMELLGLRESYRGYVPQFHALCIFTDPVNGGSPIEFVVADGGPLLKFNKGGGGIHHIALEVSDLAAMMDDFAARGLRMIEPQPVQGAGNFICNFLSPVATRGIIVEYVQMLG